MKVRFPITKPAFLRLLRAYPSATILVILGATVFAIILIAKLLTLHVHPKSAGSGESLRRPSDSRG